MTRQEWIDSIEDFDDLKRFCWENSVCEEDLNDVIDEDQLDEYVNEDVNDTGRSWRDLRDALNDIPTGSYWYRCNGSFDYDALDDSDYRDYKSDVLSYLDGIDFFDGEEEEDDDGIDPYLDIDLFDLDPEESDQPYDFGPEPEPGPEVPVLDMGLLSSLCGFNEAAVAANRRTPPPASKPPELTLGELSDLFA